MHAIRSLLVAMALGAPAFPAIAAPAPAAGKTDDAMSAARKALDEVGNYNYQNRSLNDVVTDIKEHAKVVVTIDPAVYQFGLDPTQPTVNVTLKQAKLRDVLKAVLAPYNLRFGLVREGLFVSTEEGLTSRQLRQRVSLDADESVFSTVVKQLASDTGANVVLDPRLGEKANKKVTLRLDDVPLETAIRLLAEVADLRAVRMSNVLFVTTPERAEKLRPDADGPVPAAPANPIFQFGPGGGGIAIPGFGGAVPVPLPANPPVIEAPPVPVEKKDEKPVEKK